MSQPLPIDENKFERIVCLEDVINTPDVIGFFIDVDLKYPKIIKKTQNFPFAPVNKISSQDNFKDYMNEKNLKIIYPIKSQFVIGLIRKKI